MASLVLGAAGQAAGAAILPGGVSLFGLSVSGAALGGFAGALAGSALDARWAAPDVEGPRLDALQVQSSTEGAGLPVVYGTMRVAGQIIWAARFKEKSREESGGKGGPDIRNYSYSLSFAVALGEGEIGGVGRIWADGAALDLSGVTWRVYKGGEDQAPDPLIEAVEGEDAPAYRGAAYAVFEDLDLTPFGNRIPNLSFEVVRQPPVDPGAPPRMEQLIEGVAMIPSSGEFAYATENIFRETGPGESVSETIHNSRGVPDIAASLDDLQDQLPKCGSVTLVVSWFGDDLRAGECKLRPGVEDRGKVTRPKRWSVGGRTPDMAHEVSRLDGRPAYGGTPADFAVVQAIQEMKARGLRVVFYPFILMDIAGGNGLADPYGRPEQPAFPWRGRITCHPAAGEADSPDKDAAAGAQVSAFFGAATADDFDVTGDAPVYQGEEEWSFRRMILHYAHLCAMAGGVDGFMIGSEMAGLTTIRDSADHYPAVDELRMLAAEVRGILPEAEISYAADWSEYFGHHPADGSGDVFYHLDPLWADGNIDFVGVDWYGPLSDWRDGAGHLDAALTRSPYALDYLQSQVEGGEGYDWFYASHEDRQAQIRTPVTDGAYGEPHVFRYKDLRNWWGRTHHDRPGGVREQGATAWVPESKPIRFTEIGCPAVDKGANQPNVFYDPKSSESFLPYFSDGARDDLIQRRYIEATLDYWGEENGRNPVSSVYGGPMLDVARAHVWTWDARPYPDFPAREAVWADGGNWRLGHWLTGRTGRAPLGEVVRDICGRAKLAPVDVGALDGLVAGYALSGPMTGRDALAPLARAYRFDLAERGEETAFLPRGTGPVFGAVALDNLVQPERGERFTIERAQAGDLPREARVSFIDEGKGFQPGSVSALDRDAGQARALQINLPLVFGEDAAQAIAQTALSDAQARAEALGFALPPSMAALELGDRVWFGETDRLWRIEAMSGGAAMQLSLSRAVDDALLFRAGPEPETPQPPASPASPPVLAMIDAPIFGGEIIQPGGAVSARPWTEPYGVWAGPAADLLDEALRAERPARMGELLWALHPGPAGRWDEGNRVRVRLYSGALSSAEDREVLNGANRIAVQAASGDWEILQARDCVLVEPGVFEISGLLRGLAGTDAAMTAPHPVGARVVVLDSAVQALALDESLRGGPVHLAAGPARGGAYGPSVTEAEEVWLGRALRPLSPVHARLTQMPDGLRVSWRRRTRIGGDDWAALDAPLGEAEEAYELEVLKDGDVVLSRTVETPEALLTQAELAPFFEGEVWSLDVRLYQLSARWGRGAPFAGTLYL